MEARPEKCLFEVRRYQVVETSDCTFLARIAVNQYIFESVCLCQGLTFCLDLGFLDGKFVDNLRLRIGWLLRFPYNAQWL
jgi:hypothetical protein